MKYRTVNPRWICSISQGKSFKISKVICWIVFSVIKVLRENWVLCRTTILCNYIAREGCHATLRQPHPLFCSHGTVVMKKKVPFIQNVWCILLLKGGTLLLIFISAFQLLLKEPCPILFTFFSEILVSEVNAYVFHHPLLDFIHLLRWCLMLLRNLTQYGICKQLQYNYLFMHPNGLTNFNEVWNQIYAVHDLMH